MNGEHTQEKQALPGERRSSRARGTIAFLTNTMSDDTGQALWVGATAAAKDLDLNLITFPGRCLADPRDFQAQANILYHLVSPYSANGMMSWASSISTYVTFDENRTFHEHYHPLPVVPFGGSVDGFPCLLIDGYTGMRSAITHLIETHGCRQIAFIRGPEGHSQAQERYRAYIETLKAHGLPVDSRLITTPHHWDAQSGKEAMLLLLDERKLRPQIDLRAIAAASDVLLIGALLVLHNRGIEIPEDVRAVGFNNSTQGHVHTPPLTSVAAPFHETAYQGAEMLAEMLADKPVCAKMLVPQLVIRQSCGCVDPAVAQAATTASGESRDATLSSLLASRREEILSAMAQAVGDSSAGLDAGWAARLLDGFDGDLQSETPGLFLRELNAILRQVAARDGDASAWHNVISALRQQTASHLGGMVPRQAEDLWQQARVLISGAAERAHAHRVIRAAERAQVLRDIGAALITIFDLSGLMNMLATSLPQLGIPSCYLSLYEDPQPYRYPQPAPEYSRLVLGYNEHGRTSLEPEGRRFPTRQLMPEGLLPQDRQFCFVVEPLYFQQDQIGFVLLEQGPPEGALYETLRGQISSALKGALLLQEQQRAEQALLKERDTLQTLVAQIRQSAQNVALASEEIRNSSTQMATVTEEQASAVNQITATIQEIKTSAQQVTPRAQDVAASAGQANEAAHRGIQVVQDATLGMNVIQQKVKTLAENIQALSEQAQQIGKIIDTVSDVAQQSNILALNAAIEAAHAGELGARFRVVADEVKNLAGQSRQAARQVRTILSDIQKATALAVTASQQGTEDVNAGSELVSKTAETIDALAKVVGESAQAAEQILAGVQQQTIGLNQIAVGMNDINQAAQQSATEAQQSRNAAKNLAELAEQLKNAANRNRM
jgi:methyl-accepting chemotaxis protein